jgi:hypothetical protein
MKAPAGTWFEREMFQSKAYHALNGWAPQMLTIFLSKRIIIKTGRRGKESRCCINCAELEFSYAEAKKCFDITVPRFTRALDELLAKGFISISYHGGTHRHDKSKYSLSDKWRIWTPGSILEARQRESIHRGFQGKKQKSHTKPESYTHTFP